MSSRWLVDDSWQNKNRNYLLRRHSYYTLKNRFEFQTWSNLWCFDISQVTWIKIFCQQTAFTLIQKRNSLGSIPSMLLRSLCSITARPWGHHHQFRFRKIHSNPAVRSFGSCAKHQPRPEQNGSVEGLTNSSLDPKKGLRQSRICMQVFNCCSSILTNPCKSKIINHIYSPLYWIVVPEYQENWIHTHRDPKRMNFSQQLIVQQNLSLRCP